MNQLPSKPLRIAFLSFQNNPFWFPVRDGALAAKAYLKNFNVTVDYIVMGEDMTAGRVVSAMETCIAKRYDAIAVVPIFDGTEKIIDKAVESDIPVFNFIAEGSKPSKALAFLGTGRLCGGPARGKIIEKLTGERKSRDVITGYFGATQHQQRMDGPEVLLCEKRLPASKRSWGKTRTGTAPRPPSLTRDMLTANPDLKIVYVTAGGPFGAAKAIKDLGLTGKVGVVCYDHIPENIADSAKTGQIDAASYLDQDPFGQGFDSCANNPRYLVAKQKPSSYFIPVKLTVMTPENVNQLYPRY